MWLHPYLDDKTAVLPQSQLWSGTDTVHHCCFIIKNVYSYMQSRRVSITMESVVTRLGLQLESARKH